MELGGGGSGFLCSLSSSFALLFPSPSSFSLPLSRLSLIRAFRYRGGEIANKHITSPSYIFSISHRAGIERWRKRQIDKLCILSLPQDRLDSFPSDPRVSNLDRGLPLSALSLLVVTTTLECVGFRQSHEDRRNEGALFLNRCGLEPVVTKFAGSQKIPCVGDGGIETSNRTHEGKSFTNLFVLKNLFLEKASVVKENCRNGKVTTRLPFVSGGGGGATIAPG